MPGNVEPKTDAGPSPTGSGDGRVGKRTAAAAFRIATHLVDENLITPDEALARVADHQLAQLMFPSSTARRRAPCSPAEWRHHQVAHTRRRR